jgi:hypothetical protein
MFKRLTICSLVAVIICLFVISTPAFAYDPLEDKKSALNPGSDLLNFDQQAKYARQMLQAANTSAKQWATGLWERGLIKMTIPKMEWPKISYDISTKFQGNIQNPVDAFKRAKALSDIGSIALPHTGFLPSILQSYHGCWMAIDANTSKVYKDFMSSLKSKNMMQSKETFNNIGSSFQKSLPINNVLNKPWQNPGSLGQYGSAITPSYQMPKMSTPSYQFKSSTLPSYQPKISSGFSTRK